MAFDGSLIRKIGRNIVLPTDKIKTICRKALAGRDIRTVLDFGAGTLFWTDWFIQEFGSDVYAVDTCYDNFTMSINEKITCYSDLYICLEKNAHFSLVWACDVLHHLSYSDSDVFFEKICDKTNILIIKDIDANHSFGEFMNKIHDKVINGETTYRIFPEKLTDYFESQGFETSYYYVPKIWYPHFVLIAIRKGNYTFDKQGIRNEK